MILLKQILVTTDFSDASAAAMDYGRALARTFGASLHLLHVIENQFLRPTAADPQRIKAATVNHLVERLTDEDRTALHAIAALVTSDNPAEEIVKYAGANNIEVRNGPAGGEVLDRLMRRAVFAEADRIVRHHVNDPPMHDGGEAEGGTQIVGEDEKRRAVGS